MSAEWTTEKFKALPDRTLVEVTGNDWYAKDDDSWHLVSGNLCIDSTELAAFDDVRVVSLPVAALLSDKTVRAASGGHALGRENAVARIVLQQAVAHVIGDEPQ